MSELFAWLGEHIIVLIIPFLGWLAKNQLEVSQTIYGKNGKDGMVDTVRNLAKLMNDHSTIDLRVLAAQSRADEAVKGVDDLTTRIVGGFDDLRTRLSNLETKRR